MYDLPHGSTDELSQQMTYPIWYVSLVCIYDTDSMRKCHSTSGLFIFRIEPEVQGRFAVLYALDTRCGHNVPGKAWKCAGREDRMEMVPPLNGIFYAIGMPEGTTGKRRAVKIDLSEEQRTNSYTRTPSLPDPCPTDKNIVIHHHSPP
jgi:hypothetical protein